MRITTLACLALLTGCGAAQQHQNDLAVRFVSASHDLDEATFALFKHLKPSDKDECMSRASFVPMMQYARRNNVLVSCLSAADKRNQGV